MQLQKTSDEFRKQGYNVCAISYDPVDILKKFADKRDITIPLLSDEGSKTIKAFGLLLPPREGGGKSSGLPYPGTFFISKEGIITKKSMEKDYWERKSMQSLLVSEFCLPTGTVSKKAETPQLTLTYFPSQDTITPGARITLCFTVDLKEKMHVYAPAVGEDYIPVKLALDENLAYKIKETQYPEAEVLHLDAIDGKEPVYSGKFNILQDITLHREKALKDAGLDIKSVNVKGIFSYQACDDKACYMPTKIPVELDLVLGQNDWQKIE